MRGLSESITIIVTVEAMCIIRIDVLFLLKFVLFTF